MDIPFLRVYNIGQYPVLQKLFIAIPPIAGIDHQPGGNSPGIGLHMPVAWRPG
jgi:hypothetical protein